MTDESNVTYLEQLGRPHGFNGDGYSATEQAGIPQEVNPNGDKAAQTQEFTAQDFLTRFQELSDQNVQMACRKNADYASTADPFRNFRSSELVGVPIERGMLVRLMDKVTRVSNLLDRPAQVLDESILDTLSDLSVYPIIMRIWLEQNSEGNKGS